MKDKNGQTVKIGDMIRFKEDRYNYALATIESMSDTSIQVTICGGGGMGDRTLSSLRNDIEIINSLND